MKSLRRKRWDLKRKRIKTVEDRRKERDSLVLPSLSLRLTAVGASSCIHPYHIACIKCITHEETSYFNRSPFPQCHFYPISVCLSHQQCLDRRVILVICSPVYSRLAVRIAQNDICTLSRQQNHLLHQQRRKTMNNLQLSIATWHFQHCCCKHSSVVPSSVHHIHRGNEYSCHLS